MYFRPTMVLKYYSIPVSFTGRIHLLLGQIDSFTNRLTFSFNYKYTDWVTFPLKIYRTSQFLLSDYVWYNVILTSFPSNFTFDNWVND